VSKRLVAVCLFFIVALPGLAVEDGNVMYVGGTVAGLKQGELCKLDLRSQAELSFESSSAKLLVPFAKIDSYGYSKEVAHHLGVLPAIAVGLLKKRQRKHFLRIAYHDENSAPQVVVFEVPKTMPLTLLAILQERAPQRCKPQVYEVCTAQK